MSAARKSEIPASNSTGPKSEIPLRAVVLTFDRLHLGYIGCYGNDWIETPHLDRLAANAVVFDRHCCENLDPAAANHAWWTGLYQFPLDAEGQRRCPTFLDHLHAANVATHLVVESDGRNETTVAPPFGQVTTVRGADGFDVAESETPFARTVKRCAAIVGESADAGSPALMWIKSRGVPVPWVPPQQFAELYLEEFGLSARGEEDSRDDDDEAGVGDSSEDEDADEAAQSRAPAPVDDSLDWRYAAAMYAAYVTLLDRWLGKLLAAIDESPVWKGALLIVSAGAGQALGEHGALADERILLRAECLQTPLWVRVPGSDQGGTRRQALVQTVDLAPTLLDWFRGPVATAPEFVAESEPGSQATLGGTSLLPVVSNQVNSQREVALMGHGRSEWGIRTDEFFYVEPGNRPHETDHSASLLFEKPHDRWDQFDVLSQFPQVSEDLQNALHQQIEQLETVTFHGQKKGLEH